VALLQHGHLELAGRLGSIEQIKEIPNVRHLERLICYSDEC